MRIAIFISGRATCYEECLLPFLKASPYEVHLFASLNLDPASKEAEQIQTDLNPWLKAFRASPFTLPPDFVYTHPETFAFQKVEESTEKWLPIHQMSMYFNDFKAFELIDKFQEQDQIKYDLVMKFRADICEAEWPQLQIPPAGMLHMVKPNCHFPGFGIHKVPVVSDCWVWGEPETMRKYCQTYPFVLAKLAEKKGNYLIHFETCVTDNFYSKGLSVKFFPYHYRLHKDRRTKDPLERNQAPLLHRTALNK